MFRGWFLVFKMVTVLEVCTTGSSVLLGAFMVKRLNGKDIHKKIFPVYGGKCLLANASLMTKRMKRRCRSG
jgi:hypothetical protein